MNKSVLIGLLVIIVGGLTSCSIEKRHYRKGYYINGFHKDYRSIPSEDTSAANNAIELNDRESPQDLINEENKVESVVEVADAPAERHTYDEKTSVDIIPKQEAVTTPSDKNSSAAPKLEKDKKQATGAGIAAAIFFLLGMAGLVIKGTAGAVGIFIAAAFVCFLLCVILASFLYPREPVVKQPKEEMSETKHTTLGISFAILVAIMLAVLAIFGLVLGIFFIYLF